MSEAGPQRHEPWAVDDNDAILCTRMKTDVFGTLIQDKDNSLQKISCSIRTVLECAEEETDRDGL